MFAGGERLTSIELERGRFLLLKLKSKTRKNWIFTLPMKNTILSFIQIMYFFLSFLSFLRRQVYLSAKEIYQQNFSVIVETSWAQSLRLLGIWNNKESIRSRLILFFLMHYISVIHFECAMSRSFLRFFSTHRILLNGFYFAKVKLK